MSKEILERSSAETEETPSTAWQNCLNEVLDQWRGASSDRGVANLESSSSSQHRDGTDAPVKLYVGNLPYGMTESELEKLFNSHGTVTSVQVVVDRDTGRSKGFGFISMSNAAEAQAAMQALNGKEINGRALTVNEARPKMR